MLTPKHRALFAAAYSSQLLRSPRDEGDPRVAAPQPDATPDSTTRDEEGDRPSAA